MVLVLNEAQQKLRELREAERARALLDEVGEMDDWSDSTVAGHVQSQGSKVSSGRQTPCKPPASGGPHHLNIMSQPLSEPDYNATISESEDQHVAGSGNNPGEDGSDESDEEEGNNNESAASGPGEGEGEEGDEEDTIAGVEEDETPNILAMYSLCSVPMTFKYFKLF